MLTLFFPAGQVLKTNRNWIIMAATVFTGSAIVFYYTTAAAGPAAGQALEGQLDFLDELFNLIMDTNPLAGALIVFMNNFLSMAQMLFLGFLAGISPVITLGVNGALVGALLSLSAEEGLSLFLVVTFGILPHGIFELFAFFVCGALGLKFGYHCIASPLPGKTRLQSFRYIWKEAISLMPLIVLFLLVAAFVEVLVTPHLLDFVLPAAK